jgi:hypothetical protein
MKEISIEEVYYSYLRNGVIMNWQLQQISKLDQGYQCQFRNIDTGKKETKVLRRSSDSMLNARLEAIFCD